MYDLIRPEWLRMFTAEELRLLISGAPDIDLADLKRNTNYGGGYSASHQAITCEPPLALACVAVSGGTHADVVTRRVLDHHGESRL